MNTLSVALLFSLLLLVFPTAAAAQPGLSPDSTDWSGIIHDTVLVHSIGARAAVAPALSSDPCADFQSNCCCGSSGPGCSSCTPSLFGSSLFRNTDQKKLNTYRTTASLSASFLALAALAFMVAR